MNSFAPLGLFGILTIVPTSNDVGYGYIAPSGLVCLSYRTGT